MTGMIEGSQEYNEGIIKRLHKVGHFNNSLGKKIVYVLSHLCIICLDFCENRLLFNYLLVNQPGLANIFVLIGESQFL